VQASLYYKQRLQLLFFPEGIAFDGNRFNRTAVTARLFNYLELGETGDERVVSQTSASWNQLDAWRGKWTGCGVRRSHVVRAAS